MVSWIIYLWQFPYVRWHIFFTFLPVIILWSVWGSYLQYYKKTFLYAVCASLLYGIPADLIAVDVLHIWGYEHTKHFGPFFLGLPIGEYIFIAGFPLFAVSLILVLRKYLYNKTR